MGEALTPDVCEVCEVHAGMGYAAIPARAGGGIRWVCHWCADDAAAARDMDTDRYWAAHVTWPEERVRV
jgi:uncharacterized protein CbrC (UPF0167 family)